MNHIFQDQVESEEGGGIQPGVLPRRVQSLVRCGQHPRVHLGPRHAAQPRARPPPRHEQAEAGPGQQPAAGPGAR